MFGKVSRYLKYDSNFFFVHKHIHIYGHQPRSHNPCSRLRVRGNNIISWLHTIGMIVVLLAKLSMMYFIHCYEIHWQTRCTFLFFNLPLDHCMSFIHHKSLEALRIFLLHIMDRQRLCSSRSSGVMNTSWYIPSAIFFWTSRPLWS